MKLFKPYVNLTKSATTGTYTLNAVVSLPAGSTIESITQEETMAKDQKAWGVNLNVKLNGTTTETQTEDFSIELNEGPQADRQKIRMSVYQMDTTTQSAAPVNDGETDVDYDDASEDMI